MRSVDHSFDDFQKGYDAGKPHVLWLETPADLDTPVSTFIKLAGDDPYSFLLESVEGGAVLGRYSFIGLDPDKIWQCQDGVASTANRDINGEVSTFSADEDAPIQSLRNAIKDGATMDIPPHLPPSCVGYFGYLGYDMVTYMEDLPKTNPDPLDIPDGIMVRPRLIVIFDNIKQVMTCVTPVWPHKDVSAREAFDTAQSYLKNNIKKLSKAIEYKSQKSIAPALKPQSNMTQEQFYKSVETAKDYILAGDIFQVVLSQRFAVPFKKPAIDLYRSLRRLNPSPFLFYLNMDSFQMVGSSPEILVRVRDNKITIRPIAGTRKRGANDAEDKALAEDLLSDPKERAEHLMLLDLGRNDVGRCAKLGSVDVTAQYTIEHYSHVMHIVSNVEGELREDMDGLDALCAGFPAGTVSGAPKIRAMEIIDELEPEQRRFYAGCVGYLGFDGSVDSCITLRTGLVKDDTLYVQAGGGIVADSTPEGEFEESINKAKALIVAAENT